MPETKSKKKSDDTLLREIRENFDFDTDAFSDIRNEGSTDIKYCANDPWPDKEKQNRREAGRPLLSIDQLNQYTNQVINEVRQHPREIKIAPAGYGATDKLAELRENRIRAIQYKSDAQAAYVTAMENACQRSYGYARVSLRYVSEKSFDQEIVIKRVPNPDAVLFDTGCKELDCSDAEHCFITDTISKKDFRRQYPDAEIKDFAGELARDYPRWIQDKYIQIAEYWRVEKTKDTLIQFDGLKAGALTDLESKLEKMGCRIEDDLVIFPSVDGAPEIRAKILNTRETKLPKVWQYITNGVEILEENEWLGKWIPIVPIFGKELYVTEAGGSKRLIMSLIRNARDAQMGYNYAKTCQTEAVGMVPRTTYLAVEGQFEGHEEEVADANKNPKPFLYYRAFMPDVMTAGSEPLPPPIREPFDPPVQNLEILSDSFRQAIQTTVGMYNTSVGRNDTNVKSGVAIKELDAQSDLGAFHFIANYNRFITAIGRIVNDLQSKIETSPRQVPIRKADGTEELVWVNKPYTDDQGQTQHHDMTLGEYDVTVSVGPNADSQRDEASDFIETFIENLPNMQMDPAKKDALLALAIKIKQMGPIADQMVDILQPPQGDPSQLQGQLQQLQAQLQQLETENAALHEDRAARVLEQQTKIQIEQMKQEGKGAADAADHTNQQQLATLANDLKVLIAEIQTKAQDSSERLQMYKEFWLENHKAAHDVGMQAADQQHAQTLADQQAQTAAQTQASDQAHQQTMAQQAQPSATSSRE